MSASYNEKDGLQSSTSAMDNTEAIPEYDDVLESALDTLDGYQAKRADMDRHLKTAYFNLAQAKQALGPARVGPASFRLTRLEPLITVNIDTQSSQHAAFVLQQAFPVPQGSNESAKGKERERKNPIDLRMAASTSALYLNEKGTSSSLRGRSALGSSSNVSSALRSPDHSLSEKSAAGVGVSQHSGMDSKEKPDDAKEEEETDADGPPAYSEAVNEYLLDPIQQFSAFPPTTLRNAQKAFRKALQESISVLMAQRQFEGMCIAADGMASGKKEG